MWFLVSILNALAKNIIPLIRQKSFLEKTKKGGWPVTSPHRGGPGGHPPRHHTYHHPSPPKARAVFMKTVTLTLLLEYVFTLLLFAWN